MSRSKKATSVQHKFAMPEVSPTAGNCVASGGDAPEGGATPIGGAADRLRTDGDITGRGYSPR